MYVVIVGFFEAPGALQAHYTTPQMWTPSDRSIINRTAGSVDVSLEHSKCYCLNSFQTATREDWSYEDEQPDEFPNVLTNSSGALIGGSCGGSVFVCVVIYILYKLLKPERTVVPADTKSEPIVIHVRPAEGATNQNETDCPSCRDTPSSPPPYNEGCFYPPSTASSTPCSCQQLD
ncbi:hypothetical protein ACROYT_G024487 [Oculina patagonica]